MTTTIIEDRPRLAPTVKTLLRALRRRIRRYVWLEGVTTAATWLGVAFWASLAVDWVFEPPVAVRGLLLAAVVLVFGGVVIQLIVRRAFVRLSDSNMAMLLERRFPGFNDGLLTAVVLTGRRGDLDGCDRQMLARTCRLAAEQTGEVKLGRVFNPVPLRRSVCAAVLLMVTVVMFAYQSPGALATWGRRSLMMHDILWPRKVHLTVDGFEGGVKKVARGADLEVIVRADTRWPRVPDVVQIRYRAEGGVRHRKTMNRLGIEDSFQKFSYTFEGILAPIRFEVVGGDDRRAGLRIEVVESPAVEMELELVYPAYMQRSRRILPVTGSMPVPRGTEVIVHARANKDLTEVRVEHDTGKELLLREVLDSEGLAADPRCFRHVIESLDEDTELLFTLSDSDGITTRRPVRLALVATADEPPQFAGARLDGIGPAITAKARVPAIGRITDDYGIDRVWFELTIDQQEPATRPIASPPSHTADLKLDAALDVRDLNLTPGQKLLLCVKAADGCNLGEEPNIGTSRFGAKDIVTPDRLRAMLESRELVQRQRFEAVIQEVTETRNLLLRIDFRLSDTTERQLVSRTLQVQRVVQNSRKNAHETLGVADTFDDIRKQLINNRIDTEELNIRLKQGIADPLHSIAEKMFPELQECLEELQANLADEQLGPNRRDLARERADAILVEMQKVLNRMLELESFHEALELLRSIIKQQEQLSEQTQQRQKEKLRELLED